MRYIYRYVSVDVISIQIRMSIVEGNNCDQKDAWLSGAGKYFSESDAVDRLCE